MPRYAKPITKQELEDYLLNKSREIHEVDEDEDEYEYNEIDLYALADLTPRKDWKVDFSCENEVVLKFYSMNGFAVALWQVGGDWEVPMYFAMYLDDKDKLRVYVPTYGNVFNIYTKTAFGSETLMFGELAPDTMPEALRKSYDENRDEYKKYVKEVENSENINYMLADIAARICVKGNDVIPLPKNIKFPYYKGIKPKKTK